MQIKNITLLIKWILNWKTSNQRTANRSKNQIIYKTNKKYCKVKMTKDYQFKTKTRNSLFKGQIALDMMIKDKSKV